MEKRRLTCQGVRKVVKSTLVAITTFAVA